MSTARIIVITFLWILTYIVCTILLCAISFEFMPTHIVLEDGTEGHIMATANIAFGLITAIPLSLLFIPLFKWLTKIKIQ